MSSQHVFCNTILKTDDMNARVNMYFLIRAILFVCYSRIMFGRTYRLHTPNKWPSTYSPESSLFENREMSCRRQPSCSYIQSFKNALFVEF